MRRSNTLLLQVVPHLGVFLSSFVLLNELSSVIPGSSPPLINFAKCYATYGLIERLRAFQERGPTGLEPKPELLSYLSHYESISYADSLPLSQAIEPPLADGSNPPFPLCVLFSHFDNINSADWPARPRAAT